MANSFRVGDHIYVETGNSAEPYKIRRIEEIRKTPAGRVEVKVRLYFRRGEIWPNLLNLVDLSRSEAFDLESLTDDERERLAYRELFSSLDLNETIPAASIRGKCSVFKLSEVESPRSYIDHPDKFFFTFTYCPTERGLDCEGNDLHIGKEYQAQVLPMLKGDDDERKSDLETPVWKPDNGLSVGELHDYLKNATAVATFSRNLYGSGALQRRSLLMSAVSASRDCNQFHALNLLHENNYVVPEPGHTYITEDRLEGCRDQLDEWSPQEADLFECCLQRLGKDFGRIRSEVLPWKSVAQIVEYYYFWKTTNRYLPMKAAKSNKVRSKLTCITFRESPVLQRFKNVAQNVLPLVVDEKPVCANCKRGASSGWFPIASLRSAACSTCWQFWKLYGSNRKP